MTKINTNKVNDLELTKLKWDELEAVFDEIVKVIPDYVYQNEAEKAFREAYLRHKATQV